MNKILGISAYYHDSAAAILIDGELVAAAQEERFTRKKHDPCFPSNAVRYLLSETGLTLSDIDAIAFYDKPYIKFERLLESYHALIPQGLKSFLSAMPVWIKEKLFMRHNIWMELKKLNNSRLKKKPVLIFPEHHLSHAASAFYPSPYIESAILTIDGVGEWATTTICHGKGNEITNLLELSFPHSLGLLYSAFTAFCGFKVNSGEYKLMGLAPYGQPEGEKKKKFKAKILEYLVDIKRDGSILLNMDYFDYVTGLKMFKSKKWKELFSIPPRLPESELTQEYMDLALALQEITEEIVLKLASTAHSITGSSNLVMAGGVALNCVANGKLLQSDIFDHIWFQPAAGDAGGAVGAAFAAYHIYYQAPRFQEHAPQKTDCTEINTTDYTKSEKTYIKTKSVPMKSRSDLMKGTYLGPKFTSNHIDTLKYKYNAVFKKYSNFDLLCTDIAKQIAKAKVVGWFQGRMEWGPRALGNRSIVADPGNPDTQKKLNLKIKYREGFRPFAPSVLAEDAKNYFDLPDISPYMMLVAPIKANIRCPEPPGYATFDLYKRLYHIRSDIPAVTHVDYSARIQTVHKETNEKYWRLINAFKMLTGIGLVVNTSFNVRGEPIVCTPEDAYRCFMRTEMDILVIENMVFYKKMQPEFQETEIWQEKFELD